MANRKYEHDNIALCLYFCKDIMSRSTGRQVVKVILDSFHWEDWALRTDDGWWKGKDMEEYAGDPELQKTIPPLREVKIDEFIDLEWEREDEDIQVEVFRTRDQSIEVDIASPELGGSKLEKVKIALLWNFGITEYTFTFGRIWIEFPAAMITEKRMNALIECAVRLVEPTEASYGYIAHRYEERPWCIDKSLHDVFWVTLFGPDYVEMIGREKFEGLPCHEKRSLPDGSILLILTPKYEDYVKPEGKKLKKEIKKLLGKKWFRRQLLKPAWYPRLRNLVIPPEYEAKDRRKQALGKKV